mgnify:CR=1 FL=1
MMNKTMKIKMMVAGVGVVEVEVRADWTLATLHEDIKAAVVSMTSKVAPQSTNAAQTTRSQPLTFVRCLEGFAANLRTLGRKP